MTIITNIDVGRELTDAEKTARDAYMETQVAAGLTNGQNSAVPNAFTGIRVWSTTDAANAYVTWANTNYNPAPVFIAVQTVTP